MVAVVPYPASMGTALQRVLSARTAHFIHQDGACACPKVASARGTQRLATAQEAAHNSGILDVPAIVAYGSPHPLVLHLQPALTAVSPAYQAQSQVYGAREVSLGQASIVGTEGDICSEILLCAPKLPLILLSLRGNTLTTKLYYVI